MFEERRADADKPEHVKTPVCAGRAEMPSFSLLSLKFLLAWPKVAKHERTDPKKDRAIPGAGGVVFNAQGEALILRHKNGTWVFPKGHIDPGESALEAALREVEEEAGVEARALNGLSELTHYRNDKKEKRTITWFLMVTSATEPLLREATFPEGDFFSPERVEQILSFSEDKRLFGRMLAHFRSAKGDS